MQSEVTYRVPFLRLGRLGRVIFLGLNMAIASGCVPYFYEGKAALLNESTEFEVTREDRSWGDCYFKIKKMPTVYRLKAERYTIMVTQGERYWPEFFLEVLSSEGLGLTLSGEHIERLKFHDGSDMRRFREARGTNPTHQTVRLTEVPNGVLYVDVIDDGGNLIGRHDLEFALIDVDCFAWDAI